MARITSKQAKEMNEAYAKVHQNLSEKYVSKLKQQQLAKQAAEAETNRQAAEIKKKDPDALKRSFSGALLNKNTSNNNNQPANNNQSTQKPVAQNTQTTQKPVTQNNNQSSSGGLTTLSGRPSRLSGRAQQAVLNMKKDVNDAGVKSNEGPSTVSKVNSTGTAQKVDNQSSGGSTGGSVKFSGQQLKGLLDSQKGIGNNQQQSGGQTQSGGQQQQQQRPAAQQQQQQRPAAQQQQQQKPGALSRLGSLAGRAVGAARNVAGNVKQGVQSAASNVKQGAQAVAGGIKQGAQAVAGALANKGPIQGRQTGAQRRAQQTGQPVPQAQPAQQAKPVPQAQPAQQAKPVQAAPVAKPVPQAQPAQQQQSQRPSPMERRNARVSAKLNRSPLKRPGAQRAMQMAKERLAAKNAPINASYDLFDDTVQFLVSEGHAKDRSEAMSIMSESEFIDSFNQELNG